VKRAAILIGVLALMAGLAYLVAHPTADPTVVEPYVGERGASRTKASGLAISFARGAEVQALAPGTPLRAGDALRFAVRAERARHLMVRLRDGDAPAETIFPAGASASALVQPGEKLPARHVVTPGAGKVVVTAVFADHPFPLDGARGDDVEEIDRVMEKETD
jgi:hypothetical protein